MGSSRYDVGDDESQDSAEAAVTAARVAANTSHNSGRQKCNNSSASSSRDGAVSAAALLAQRDAEVATLKAETDALRRAYAALEADALAKAEEQEAVKKNREWFTCGHTFLQLYAFRLKRTLDMNILRQGCCMVPSMRAMNI